MSRRQVELEFRLLGPLEARANGAAVVLSGTKPRALLAILLAHRGRVISLDALLEHLWAGSPPRTATAALHNYVSQLRRELAAAGATDVLLTRPPGYLLDVDAGSVDADRFERLLKEGRAALAEGDAAVAAGRFRSALDLWRGPALADFSYEPFAQVEIARLEELRLEAVEERVEADLALGRDADLVAELEGMVASHPLRERLWGQLMLALYRRGRQADALAAYRTIRENLDRELGLEPSPALKALELAILRQEESVLAPSSSAARLDPARRRPVVVLTAELRRPPHSSRRLDPEVIDGIVVRCQETAAAVIEHHGGIFESHGDSVLAVFGVPAAREDDATRAARAAVELRGQLRRLCGEAGRDFGVSLAVTLSIAAGEALVRGTRVTGDLLRRARQLNRRARAWEICVGARAAELLASATVLRRTGHGTVLTRLTSAGSSLARPDDVPLVGRSDELAALEESLEASVRRGEPRAVVVLGPPGVGKSRLLREFGRRTGDRATVLFTGCSSYGDETIAPLRTAVAEAAGAVSATAIGELLGEGAESVAERLVAALGGGRVPTDEVPRLFRRVLEAAAARRPAVLVLDDLHAAGDVVFAAVEDLVARARGAIVVVGVARDELAERRPTFLREEGHARWLRLAELGQTEAAELVDVLLHGRRLAPDVRAHVVSSAGGNALFLEQLVAHAVSAADRARVPATLEALLAARLDRLSAAERAVLEHAAVVGHEFSLATVVELLVPEDAVRARDHLAALVGVGLVEATTTSLAFDEGFRFHHGLVHEATLDAIPKVQRAEIHERHADALQRRGAADELVGFHLEQAYRLLVALGSEKRRVRGLRDEAGERLAAAGLEAWQRGALDAAVGRLRRAAELLPPTHAARGPLLCELALALWLDGSLGEATRLLQRVAEDIETDARAAHRARIELAKIRLFTDAQGAGTQLLELGSQAMPLFEALGDDRALASTLYGLAYLHGGMRCRYAASEAAAERALVHYRRSGWPSSGILSSLAAAAYYGPRPVVDALARCDRLLAEADLLGRANVLTYAGGLEAMRGHWEAARRALAEARDAFADLGLQLSIWTTWAPVAGTLEALAGDVEAGAAIMTEACEALEQGAVARTSLATQAAHLAGILDVLGRSTEAERWLEVSEACAASDDLSAQIQRRAVGAAMLARRGVYEDGMRLAQEAAALAANVDAFGARASAHLGLAAVLSARGCRDEARVHACSAVEVYEEKGNAVAARAVRDLLDAPVVA